MGLEDTATGGGVHVNDITMVLQGHVKDGYRFNPAGLLSKENANNHRRSTLNDKVHCLVSVLPADKIVMMDDDPEGVISQMRKIRKEAAELRIPQVVFMTMVDKACTEVNKDLKMIYRSKKIKEKMQECSNKLGVPMTCVFPVKNYHEEIELHNDVDILLLSALIPILNFANDHVGEQVNDEGCHHPDMSFDNWRVINFDVLRKTQMIEEVRNLKIRHPKVEHLRLLVLGPVGAGKSTLINSIDSIFHGRMSQRALVDTATNVSFTQKFQTQKIRDGESGKFLPFVICDIMGLEDTATGGGVHVNDITMVLQGHVKDGYRFKPGESLRKEDPSYHRRPTLKDKVHCLVTVFPADKIFTMDHDEDGIISKMREIRKEAAALKIPQVVLMSMVDKACTEVNKDLKMIYRSKKIKEKMQECSNKLGVPMTCVFPVKNYHEEIELHNDVDILLLSALIPILNFANDYVGEQVNDERSSIRQLRARLSTHF
ncbi:hypothetical protein ACEWY4_003667 [Coilia grayii]|uniref:G domain-containing protein n=1 Tax=Coilia grayii TaxID=363190 RepID=A0ABD1KRW2_9TELE